MKAKRKALIILDILFLTVHLYWFISDIIYKGVNLSKPFYLFMGEAYIWSFLYTFTTTLGLMIITDFILIIINVCLFIKMLRKKEERDKSYPIIATYAIFSGLAYFSIIIGIIYEKLML